MTPRLDALESEKVALLKRVQEIDEETANDKCLFALFMGLFRWLDYGVCVTNFVKQSLNSFVFDIS